MKRLANKIGESKKVLVLLAVMLIASSGLFAQKSVSKWKLFKTNKADTEFVYSESNAIAVVSYDNYLKTLDFVIEDKVELEDWMTDATSWENELADSETVIEEELVVEDWMYNFTLPTEVNDSELALEDWMNTTECWR